MAIETAASAASWYLLEMQILGPRSDLLNQQSVFTSFQLSPMHARAGKPLVYMPSGDPSHRNVGFPEELDEMKIGAWFVTSS